VLLSDVLKTFSDDAAANEYLLSLGDIALVARLRELADAEGESLGEYASTAVQRYTSQASGEEWLTLLGLLSRTDDPANVCLRRALEQSASA
jgi:hypothetical protein